MTPKSEVFLMDNMEGMRKYPDGYFELAIVDPPYGIGEFTRSTSRGKKVKRKYTGGKDWNESGPEDTYFTELCRVSKNQIIWGANYFNCFTTGGVIIWDKHNNHQDMSRCEIASCSLIRTVDLFDYQWAAFDEKDKVHPCQKPVALYKWLLKNYAKPGDKILDTHLGSGSSRIAAYDMGFDFTGFELDKDYFDASVKRFEQYKAQLKLF